MIVFAASAVLLGQPPTIETRLDGFDRYTAQVLVDWNVPGIGVGIVVEDKLAFAKGYGYRRYAMRATRRNWAASEPSMPAGRDCRDRAVSARAKP